MTTVKKNGGFTLMELMITLAIIAILASVALPSYTQYIVRSKLTEGTQTLSTMMITMNQYLSDNGNYWKSATDKTCGGVIPTKPDYFIYSCTTDTTNGNTFTVTMTGILANKTYTYTVNELGNKAMTSPETKDCWDIGSNCIK